VNNALKEGGRWATECLSLRETEPARCVSVCGLHITSVVGIARAYVARF